MPVTHITLDMLKRHRACDDQQRLFLATFGESAELTDDNLTKALAVGLSVSWLACLLPAPARAEYQRVKATARAEYERITAPARAEYDRITAPAWAEYEHITASALAEYQRIAATARAEYQRIEAPAWAEYRRIAAQTVVNLLRGI